MGNNQGRFAVSAGEGVGGGATSVEPQAAPPRPAPEPEESAIHINVVAEGAQDESLIVFRKDGRITIRGTVYKAGASEVFQAFRDWLVKEGHLKG